MTEPTPGASKTYIPFVTDLMRVLRVLVSPTAVFEEQREKPTWFMPWLVIAILCTLVGLVNMPYTDRIMAIGMQSSGREVTDTMRSVGRIIGMVAAPVALLIFGAIAALIMWVVVMLSGEKVRYKGLLSVAIFSESTALIQFILQGITYRLRGSPEEAVKTMLDSRVSYGLDLLLSADSTVSGFIRGLMMGIGPVQIWSLIITAVGIMVLEKQKKGTAWTAALVTFLLILLIGAAAGAKQLNPSS